MEITIEVLEKRKSELEISKENLISKIQAHVGAIQDCEFWIEQLQIPKDGEVGLPAD